MAPAFEFDQRRRSRVSLGLGMVYAGLCITVLAFVWMIMGPLLLLRVQGGALRTLLSSHLAIVAGMFVLAIALGIAGRLLCLAVPRRDMGIVFFAALALAVGLDLLGVAVFAAAILHFYWPQVPALKVLEGWSMTLSVVGHCCFLVFLWRLAVVIDRKGSRSWRLSRRRSLPSLCTCCRPGSTGKRWRGRSPNCCLRD